MRVYSNVHIFVSFRCLFVFFDELISINSPHFIKSEFFAVAPYKLASKSKSLKLETSAPVQPYVLVYIRAK